MKATIKGVTLGMISALVFAYNIPASLILTGLYATLRYVQSKGI